MITFKKYHLILKHTPSLIVGVFATGFVLTVVAIVSNLSLLSQIVFDSHVLVSTKIQFFLSLYGSLLTNQTVVSGTVVILIALLFGVQAALIMYYISIMKQIRLTRRIGVSSLGGLIAGFLGIGCAACGSVILTAVLSGTGSALLLLLPLQGLEIGFLGIGLLLYAIKKLLEEIEKGRVC
jgi:hypothetical protein